MTLGQRLAGVCFLPVLLALVSLPVHADELLLNDGRIISGRPVAETAGGVKVEFENGEVFIPRHMIRAVARAQGDQGTQVIAEVRRHRRWRNRFKEQTAHFQFEFTSPPAITREYMKLAEGCFAAFAKFWDVDSSGRSRLKVCIFHDRDSFVRISAGPRNANCYFRFVEPIEFELFHHERLCASTRSAIGFGAARYGLHLIAPKFEFPGWLRRGLAAYYAGAVWEGSTCLARIGDPEEFILALVKHEAETGLRPSLESLLAPQSKIDRHTWGWSFVYYLMTRHRDAFRSFVKALPTHPHTKPGKTRTRLPDIYVRATLEEHLGSIDALEKGWHSHIDGLELKTPHGLEHAAHLAKADGKIKRATKLMKQAIAAGGRRPHSFRALGRWRLAAGDAEAAEAAFVEANQLDPLDAATWWYLGVIRKDERLKRLAREIDPDCTVFAKKLRKSQ